MSVGGSGSAAAKPSTRSVPATPSDWRSPKPTSRAHQRPAGPWSPPTDKSHNSPQTASSSAAQGSGTWSPGQRSSRSNSDGEGFNSLSAMSAAGGDMDARPHRRTQSKPTAADQSARPYEINGVDAATPSAQRRSGGRPLSMSAVPSTGRNSSGMHSASSDQWWEHVLPPGQLAERLRRAQAGSPSLGGDGGEASLRPSSGAGSSASSTASSQMPSERAIWSGLAGIARAATQSDAARPATRPVLDTRSSSAQAQPRRSALRGSRASSRAANQQGEYTSGEGSLSSDGGSLSPGDASPPLAEAERTTWSQQGSLSPPHARAQLEHAQAMSPGGTAVAPWPQSRERLAPGAGSPHGSFSRSSSGRRSRVVSEAGLGLGFPVDSPDALSSWEQSAPASLKPFPSSGSVGRVSPAYYLSSTPESSEEEQLERGASGARMTTTTTTTTRFTRTLSTTSITSLGNGAGYQLDDEHSHTEASIRRRVSFSQDVKSGSSSTPPSLSRRGSAQLHGAGYGAASSSRPPQSASQSARFARNEYAFDSLPPSSTWYHAEFRMGSGRRPRTMSRDGFSRRMPSYSAPTSPRNSIHLLDGDRPRFDMPRRRSPERADLHNAPDLALLNSLNVAQTQLASAGNLALTLTRHLSAPLRPVLHFTLFATISSVTLLALLSFLCASYALTFWDDVGSRGRKVGVAASQARKTLDIGVEWGRRWLGVPALALPQKPANEEKPAPSRPSSRPTQHHRRRSSASSLVLAPLYFTMSVPVAIAHKLTPSSLAERFGVEVEEMQPPKRRRSGPGDSPTGSAQASATSSRRESWATGASPMSATVEDAADDAMPSLGAGSTGMPPRPPLSHLLPSIFFTLLLALFAGLASFIASRRAGKPAADAPMTAHGPAAPAQSRKVRPASSRKSPHISSPSLDFAEQRFC